jgi:hypothetical protein
LNPFLRTGAVAGVLALATSAATASPNLVVNGGFENTTLTAPGFAVGQLPGWNVAWPDYLWFPGTADLPPNPSANWGPNSGANNGFPATSPNGGNFLEQDPYYGTSLTQSISGLSTSSTYKLQFYWAASTWTGAMLASTTRYYQVSLGAQTVATAPVTLGPKGFGGWTLETFYFNPTSATELLSFMSIGTGDPPIALLDGISLTEVTGRGVPEPGVWLMLTLGVGVLGGSARRRRSRSPGC